MKGAKQKQSRPNDLAMKCTKLVRNGTCRRRNDGTKQSGDETIGEETTFLTQSGHEMARTK